VVGEETSLMGTDGSDHRVAALAHGWGIKAMVKRWPTAQDGLVAEEVPAACPISNRRSPCMPN
jgi:hypothetical protein